MDGLTFWGSTSFLYVFGVSKKYRFKVETGHFPRKGLRLCGLSLSRCQK